MSNEHRSCPCLHTTPCHPKCTCVMGHSSRGCRRCCSYGSKEQQTVRAAYLAKVMDENAGLKRDLALLALAKVGECEPLKAALGLDAEAKKGYWSKI